MRFVFFSETDMNLLKTSIQLNPWQLGLDKWHDVAKVLAEKTGYKLIGRNCRKTIKILLAKMEKEELQTL